MAGCPGLHRLVAIDLNLGRFKPEHEGQMLLYLRYLNRNDRREGEETPIGLILCSILFDFGQKHSGLHAAEPKIGRNIR
ncbi:PDDEXK nuclease domain-containing protein [Duncaniella muris]|uniref:PDDEXK nuclease domain-containing protein n=1 Tax=Duncaniella muris TaxID=2094150 RepID=UPI0025B7632E|nr:PDDEXK nuclease domain-containing protein [Duncaniella muris]